MSQDRTAGYAERIQKALQEGPRPMSVRAFGEEMEERFPDLRGATYGGVRVYANGNVRSPRIALLRAMADVLGVRADWLVFGDGSMTEAEEEARTATEAAIPGADLLEDVLEGAARGFGPGADRLFGEEGNRRGLRSAVVLHTWRRLLFSVPGRDLFEDGRSEELPVRIGKTLRAAFDALEVDPDDVSDHRLTDYVSAVCQGLRALAEPAPASPSIRQEGADGD